MKYSSAMLQYFLIAFLVPVRADLLISDQYVESENLARFATQIFLSECKTCQSVWVFIIDDGATSSLFLKNIALALPLTGLFLYKLDNFTAVQTGDYPAYKPEMTIIFLSDNNYDATDEILYAMEELPYWNTRGMYLLIATGVSNTEDEDWIESSFRALWERQILRVLICIWQQNLKIYSYNPFLDNYGTDSTNSTNLYDLLEHKIKNMNGYPIKLYYFDLVLGRRNSKNQNGKWVGADGLFFETVAETINASLEVHPLSDDFTYEVIKNTDTTQPLATFLSVFSELYNFDAVFTKTNIYRDDTYDHIFVPERNDLFIIVPRSEKIPEYLYIYLIVPYKVWCAIIASLICVSAVIIYIQKYNSEKVDTVRVFMDNCRLLLNESIPDIRRRPQENFLILIWLLLCIVLATLFHSMLTSTLLVPKYYPEVDSLDDLYKTNLDIWVPSYRHEQLNKIKENSRLMDRLRIVPREMTFIGENMDWIEHYRYNSAVVLTQEQIELLKLGLPVGERSQFHVIQTSVFPCVMGYIVRSQNLYLAQLQTVYYRLIESGINDHWQKYNFGMKLVQDNKTIYTTDDNDDVQTVSVKHLQSVFILLLAGYCLATITFCLELILQFKNKCVKE